jgi:predicted nucleic-acid-binding Zn-ribbon protein
MNADTPDGLQRWVLENADGACPACNAQDWAADDYTVVAPYANASLKGLTREFVVVVCNACGYSRFHAVGVVEKKLV